MFRSRVFALLASVLISLGVIAAATVPASAATDTITIVSVGSPASAAGELAVVADSTTAITSLTVHLLDATGTDVLDPAMSKTSQETTSTGYQSTWTVTTPIAVGTSAPDLPLGSYTASVDATDAGTSVTGVNGGTYQFKDVLTLTIGANHTVLSYDDQSATVTGTATVLTPGATSPAPFADQQITLATSDGSDIPLTTDASGNYSYTFTPLGAETVFTYLNPTTTTFNAASPPLNFTMHWDPVKISAKLSASTVTYGTKVTLSGTLTYEPDSTYVPLAGQKVAIYSSMDANAPVATPVTDASGDFSVVLPQTTSSQVWILDAGDGVGGPYLSAATASLAEHVQIPTAITGFHVSLNQYWQLGYSGCLALAKPIAGVSVAQTSGLTIQYALGPKGPWRTLAKSVSTGGPCGTSGIAFSGKATAPSNYAYYRAVYAGTTGLDTTDYTPASTGGTLVWKYEDRITAFSVSARVVNKNARLTVKGQLQYWYSGWHNYRGQQILIVLRPKGSGTWYWIAKVNTNSTGHFSATIDDPVSATWSAVYDGNSSHLDTGAAEIYVRVRLSVANRELIVLGTASQAPTRRRNHNGYFLRWDSSGLLFDPGEGTQRQMLFAGVTAHQISHICVTHFHGDHCLGLPGVIQRIALDRVPHPVEICYPAASADVYQRLRHAGLFHDTVILKEHPIRNDGAVITAEPFHLKARELSHLVPTFGYRLTEPDGLRMLPGELAARGISGPDIGELRRTGSLRGVTLDEVSVLRRGQRFAFIMDTRLCDAAFELASGADLLVCESTFASSQESLAREYGHLTARQAGRIAAESGARSLVLTHFSQRYEHGSESRMLAEAAEEFGGAITLVSDLDVVPVPPRR